MLYHHMSKINNKYKTQIRFLFYFLAFFFGTLETPGG